MHRSRRVKITDLNPHITCVLCSGYLIDATTIIECLHSFCRKCLVKYLESNKYCPICDVQVHKTKPLLNIRSDQTLQDIVYKLVPGLFQNEMCRRRDFYAKHPEQKPLTPEERGDVTQVSHIYTPDESISLSLEYYNNNVTYDDNNTVETKVQPTSTRRYLRCPAAVTVAHLQKLIRAKYGLSNEHRVDILYKNDKLSEDFTLMDIAYIYLWRRKGPMHLTYRIFEVAKRIKLNENLTEKELKIEEEVKNEWKEVQLQISENGIMSVTNIAKTPETTDSNIVEVNLLKKENVPELSPIPKTEETQENVEKKDEKIEKAVINNDVIKLGKHKLQQDSNSDPSIEPSAKISKSILNTTTNPVKNIQQLSRNHPLKIHSQTTTNKNISNNNPQVTKTQNASVNTQVVQLIKPSLNNNTTIKTSPSMQLQKELIVTSVPQTVTSTSLVQNTPKSNNQNTIKTNSIIITTINSTVDTQPCNTSTTAVTSNIPKYTQAGQMLDNTRVTKSEESPQILNQKQPISSASPIVSSNCIQSSKVGIVPKKSSIKVGTSLVYKTLRDPPKAWNPQIPRQNLTKPTNYPSNNGASTSDLKQRVEPTTKPAKFFKMRNNVPRFLGNPASGVKPIYQVRDGDKSPPDVNKKPTENKLNNNNDIKSVESKAKLDLKKSIIKIDPKTLRPITDKPPVPESSTSEPQTEIKINQSTVSIFNPLRTQKSQTSPKVDRKSPKSTATTTTTNSFLDPPKSPMDRRESSPKSNSSKNSNSPTSKKDKLSLNFTPPNPFIPNLASPNLAPNQFLYPNFPSYDPRVMNNLTAYHPFSMYYSQPRLNYPGLSSQNLSLTPSLMSSLNLEGLKNMRKNYDIPAMLQLNPNVDAKKPSSTCVKSPSTTKEETQTDVKIKPKLNSESVTTTTTTTNNNNKKDENSTNKETTIEPIKPKTESEINQNKIEENKKTETLPVNKTNEELKQKQDEIVLVESTKKPTPEPEKKDSPKVEEKSKENIEVGATGKDEKKSELKTEEPIKT